ncbi:MAG: hypothetical protein H0T79_23780, partial [Deltaproteobacteria bacterium]|nr:hypothetical protein [Deltaproteobacteria bacterium]
PSTVRFQVTITGSGTTPPFVVTTAAVAAGAWHHVVVVLNEPTLRVYVNGVRTELANVAVGLPPALDSIQLGGTSTAAYSGDLDEVWLAQTAIATDEAVLARYCPL